jgi:RNA polymerase sigma factor (TIGR02999 family)
MFNHQVTALLNRSNLGDASALDDVYKILYQDIKAIAGFQLQQIKPGQTITPTVLAHECYLKMSQTDQLSVASRRHFLNCLARSMRMYLIDVLRAKNSQKRQAQQAAQGLTELVGSEDVSFNLIEIDLALNKIEEVDQQLAEILQHKLIFNLTFKEIAEVCDLSERHVMRLWKQAKALLIAMLSDAAD